MAKRNWIVWVVPILTLGMLFGIFEAAWGQQKLIPLRISHQPEFETFPTWLAMQEGLDKKAGLELKLVYFDSGMPQIEALPAKQWEIGATGGVPMMMAALRYGAYMIGMTHDDGFNNLVMVRADSPILKVKGKNPKFPEVYGSAELIKGKTVLTTTVSSGHYALSSWLKVFGLRDADVKIQNLEQGQAVAAFDSGKGDIVSLWAPFSMTGLAKGWKMVANGPQAGANIPLVWVTSKEFGDKNPELVARFLKLYFQMIDRQKKETVQQAPMYQKFLKDWAGMDMQMEFVKMDIDLHPMYDLKENLRIFDSSKGPSIAYQQMSAIANFFTDNKRLKPEERDKVMKSPFITDKFLKMVK
ncbi:MAG: PhnD/SsuA/transferrin family substrate-binding protein [Syntrophaceae bacterium]|nr:PhnD/SsuA/transferrin family substrate-binding protein [Syntrophaceae bacterium]